MACQDTWNGASMHRGSLALNPSDWGRTERDGLLLGLWTSVLATDGLGGSLGSCACQFGLTLQGHQTRRSANLPCAPPRRSSFRVLASPPLAPLVSAVAFLNYTLVYVEITNLFIGFLSLILTLFFFFFFLAVCLL